LRVAGGAPLAAGAASSLAFSTRTATAANHAARTQDKVSQAAMTPNAPLQMLKDGNRRFLQQKTAGARPRDQRPDRDGRCHARCPNRAGDFQV